MKRILFDTNVVLDVLLERQPHVKASAAAWAIVESGRTEGMLAAHAVTTLHYLLRREIGTIKATRAIAALLTVFGVAEVNGAVVQEALHLTGADFEDAVTAAAARLASCEWIVTRDPKGFRSSLVRTLRPEELEPLVGRG
ncbi:MAG: PIN domain-containing protein [Candidatus Solibacter usitatus]|nr:PIN domain-containing protein [Candidatus Solibacter usitatus]